MVVTLSLSGARDLFIFVFDIPSQEYEKRVLFIIKIIEVNQISDSKSGRVTFHYLQLVVQFKHKTILRSISLTEC